MKQRALTTAERLFLAGYNPLFGVLLGWRQDSINAEFVRTYGIPGLLKFGKTIGDALKFMSERYGEASAQHVVGFAGMMNGCRFCGVGHTLTANVLIFRDLGVLYPIDEMEIPDIQHLDDLNIMKLFRKRLAGTTFARDLELIERMNELRLGAVPTESDDDLYLRAALDLWMWNNECTIETGFDIDPRDVPSFAHFNADRGLYSRYREARAKAATPVRRLP